MSLHLFKKPSQNLKVSNSLNIKTFDNQTGPCSFFKALGHPEISHKRAALAEALRQHDNFAIYDVDGVVADFLALCELKPDEIGDIYTLKTELLGQPAVGDKVYQPITEVNSDQLLILSFDHQPFASQIAHIVPKNCNITSLYDLRLPEAMLGQPRKYLGGLNFATNFAFFREADGQHTRLTTTNYWLRYGAKSICIYFYLINQSGQVIAKWNEDIPDSSHIINIDSQDIKSRFELDDFCGQLFIHVVGAKGHEIVKYALDTYGDDANTLSATHDANAWPSDFFAGLPAPRSDEDVILWLQNSHPVTIAPDTINLGLMGTDKLTPIKTAIPPFASYPVSIGELMPQVKWPQQFEIHAGKYFCRPRYEVVKNNGRRCIAHVNIERTDLTNDSRLNSLTSHIGKGFILPAPIFPTSKFTTTVLNTPMDISQHNLPLKLYAYNRQGEELLQHELGSLPRDHQAVININDLIADMLPSDEYGHVELAYSNDSEGNRDGWLHGHFRYQDNDTTHMAETSFGSHIFNNIMTYKNEPQSYGGRPPGVTTRLFLRLGHDLGEAFCHLIYPVSKDWHDQSNTKLQLYNQQGEMIAENTIHIPKNGSFILLVKDIFTEQELNNNPGYIIIDDRTCRLFGYHGIKRETSFSMDHMFGF